MDRKIFGMTLREVTGFVLLGVLLLTGLLGAWYLSRQQEALADRLEDSAWLALSGQWTNAREAAVSAQENWQRNWKLRAALTDHGPMEEIDVLFEELKIYGAAGEKTEFARTCSAIARRMNTLGGLQCLHWWNVL